MQWKRSKSNFYPSGKTMLFQSAVILFTLLVMTSLSWAGEDSILFDHAKRNAKDGRVDFAFMNFKEMLNYYPKSRHRLEANLAVAEYYFDNAQYKEAETLFNNSITESTDPKKKLFILAYLLKIAELKGEKNAVRDLEKKIINLQQVSLVFRNHKDFAYISPMNNHFKAVYQINTIEFYRQGALLVKISY